MTQLVSKTALYKNLTGTGGTIPGRGHMQRIFVSQASATPTIKVVDGSGTIANTFTPTAGQSYELTCEFKGDLTVTLGGTVDCTVFYVV